MIATGIIGYPISKVLDYLLGEHTTTRYSSKDLKCLIDLHSKQALDKLTEEYSLDQLDLFANSGLENIQT